MADIKETTFLQKDSAANTLFQPLYPYNSMTQTESGHSMEMDDTPTRERIRLQHRTGTFREMHPDGSMTDKIVGPTYEIICNKQNVYINGVCNITITGDSILNVQGDCYNKVGGDVHQVVTGNVDQLVNGNLTQTAKGEFNINAGGNLNIAAARVNINSGLFVRGDIGGNQSISAVGNITAQKSVSSQVSVETKGYITSVGYITSGDYITSKNDITTTGGDVKAKVSLNSHTHTAQGATSETSGPH